MAHEIPYVATATVADLRDLEYKATRAMDFHGARYLHILVPCPLGWGSSPADTIKVARLATESGLFPVFEATSGEVTGATPIRRQVPVTGYLRLQARYAHLFHPTERTEVIARIQAFADRNIARFGLVSQDPGTQRPGLIRDAETYSERGNDSDSLF
jgi:pyruvate ferredoxin oxidoreductase beta subunit